MPQLIASLVTERVVCVSVGYAHSMIVTEAGVLYSFGDNDHGQLGLGRENNVNTPCQVAIEAVTSVCAGIFHTAAITKEGGLFTWGNNVEGQLGHGDSTGHSNPTAVA